MPFIAKLGLLLLVFLVAIRLKVALGPVLLICTAMVQILFPIPLADFLISVAGSIVEPTTVTLVAVVFTTLLLAGLMEQTGALQRMTESLAELIHDYRLVVALPPALIGLLPMPAGALVSAPLVNEAARSREISAETRTFINYWFRHLWEYVWPLYPGILIGAAILQVPPRSFAAAQYPLTIVAIIIGLAFLYRALPRDRDEEERRRDRAAGALRFARSVWPFLLIFAGVFVLRLPLLASLIGTTLLFILVSRRPLRGIIEVLRHSASSRVLLLLLSVMIFKRAITGSGALDAIPAVLHAAGIPPLVPLFLTPFVVALLTGTNRAYVAISFPILLPLLGGDTPDMALVMFAYVSGFLGILLSPTHLCLVTTREYFRAELRGVYRLLAIPVACLFLTSVALLLLR